MGRHLTNCFHRVLKSFGCSIHSRERQFNHTGNHFSRGDIELRMMERAGNDILMQCSFRQRGVLMAAPFTYRIDRSPHIRENDPFASTCLIVPTGTSSTDSTSTEFIHFLFLLCFHDVLWSSRMNIGNSDDNLAFF
jgi:hypothetical protein